MPKKLFFYLFVQPLIERKFLSFEFLFSLFVYSRKKNLFNKLDKFTENLKSRSHEVRFMFFLFQAFSQVPRVSERLQSLISMAQTKMWTSPLLSVSAHCKKSSPCLKMHLEVIRPVWQVLQIFIQKIQIDMYLQT